MTYPDAIKGLVEALRTSAVTFVDAYGGPCCRYCKRSLEHPYTLRCDPTCPGALARAALDAWDKRQPLREDVELASIVAQWAYDGEAENDRERDDIRKLLGRIDHHLFGPRAGTKEKDHG